MKVGAREVTLQDYSGEVIERATKRAVAVNVKEEEWVRDLWRPAEGHTRDVWQGWKRP